jgi:hypothetical protein
MYDNELKNKLIKLGMKEIDASTLIKVARYRKISIRKALAMQFAGTYQCVIAFLIVYVFFIWSMDKESTILFTFIYVSIIAIAYTLTPLFKGFFWSLKVLILLRGK